MSNEISNKKYSINEIAEIFGFKGPRTPNKIVNYLHLSPEIIGKQNHRYFSSDDIDKIDKFLKDNKNIDFRKFFYTQTCLEKYGVENYFESDNFKSKSKNTCMNKYGKEYFFQSNDFKKKSKQTCLERYGVNYITQFDGFRERSKKACIEKYGVENPFQSNDIKEKIKQSNLKKYGVENPALSDKIQNNKKLTCIEKYGTEYALQNKDIRNKIKDTNLKKYGVDIPTKCEKIKNKIRNTNLEKYGSECFFLSDKYLLSKQKKFEYDNLFFDSNYEIILYKYFKLNNISFEMQKPISYLDKNEKYHKYYCDFYLTDTNEYIECKNPAFFTYDNKIRTIYTKGLSESEICYRNMVEDSKLDCMKLIGVTIVTDISSLPPSWKEGDFIIKDISEFC